MINDNEINMLADWLSSLTQNEMDELLDKRDKIKFEKQWLRVFNEVSNKHLQWDGLKDVFIRLSGITQQHEITDYIGDDFDLIFRAESIGYKDAFLDKMILQYKAGKFPT